MDVTIKVKCFSKKESHNYDPKEPKVITLEMQVPYDQASTFWQTSGGTNLLFNTTNQSIADQFKVGEDYMLNITPIK